MKVVINLDEEVYNHIKQFGYFPTTYTQYIANAIFDGKLIPKECGRLVGADAIYGQLSKMIDSTPTIIGKKYAQENKHENRQM